MNVHWAHTDGDAFTILPPGSYAGDGICEDNQWGVQVEDVVVYASSPEGLRRFATNLAAELPAPGGPAVAFDEVGFRAWWPTRPADVTIDDVYDDHDGDEPGEWAEQLALYIEDHQPPWWKTAPGVGYVTVYRTAGDFGTSDGGAVITVVVDGIELAAMAANDSDLVWGDKKPDGRLTMPGMDAAACLLGAIANHVNTAAGKLRRPAARSKPSAAKRT